MKKEITILIILAVIIIILTGVLIWQPKNQTADYNYSQPLLGLEITSPKPNDMVLSPLTILGSVNGNGWIGFEGQVGTVKLFDETGNELAMGILTAQGEWMQQIIYFETILEFTRTTSDFGSLVFYNENPSGESQRDKTFTLPIKFIK